MTIFNLLLVILFSATAVFYVVFFALCYYWHEKKDNYIVIPLYYTFEFFAVGFLIVSIIGIVVNFSPLLLQVLLNLRGQNQ